MPGVTYTRSPGILNRVTSITNSVGPSAGFVIGSNISKDFDFTISYLGSYTFARNSVQTNSNSNYYSHTASLKWVWEFWNGFVLNNQVSNAVTSGLAEGFNENIILWNLSVAKKFLTDEKAEIKFGVSDLLAQNTSVSPLRHKHLHRRYLQSGAAAVFHSHVYLYPAVKGK